VQFCFEDPAEILSVEIEKATRPANDCTVHVHQDKLGCFTYKFKFLDRGDGVLIRILHTGQKINPTCSGTIINLPDGIQFLGRIPVQTNRQTSGSTPLSSLPPWSLRVVVVTILAIYSAFGAYYFAISRIRDAISMGMAGGLFSLGVFWWLWITRRRYPNFLVPNQITENRDTSQNT